MEIIIQPDPASASRIAALRIAETVRDKPDAVLGLATGSSPRPLYAELIRLHQKEALDFSQVRTFNLDEYVGLSSEHSQSYAHFMRVHFFDHINVRKENTHIPDGLTPGQEIPSACSAYERAIADAGGIDIQVLGIGGDGHIGFNEPSSSLSSRTRIKTLTERTRADNAPNFPDPGQVPHHVITMGIGTILDAREILLLAFGENKAAAVAGALEGPVTASNPASILQMHPRVTCLLDDAAAAELKRADYYRWVYSKKPKWQR